MYLVVGSQNFLYMKFDIQSILELPTRWADAYTYYMRLSIVFIVPYLS